MTVGAVLGYAGTPLRDALPSTWRVVPSALARQSSELRETRSTSFYTDAAKAADSSNPALPADAGALVLAASRADLSGTVRFDVGDGTGPNGSNGSSGAGGRGGQAYFASDRIVVGPKGTGADAGALSLTVDQLNRLGAETLVLGATPGMPAGAPSVASAGQQPISLDVRAALPSVNRYGICS